ncbi:MAG: hypothetical protein M3437_15305 [Chloroflexota bacterium]|nr:hypothetical protein [Chloroflexota bacterium]MDQ5865249.1 hypothetical protein [Chloroflexota bacterium]
MQRKEPDKISLDALAKELLEAKIVAALNRIFGSDDLKQIKSLESVTIFRIRRGRVEYVKAGSISLMKIYFALISIIAAALYCLIGDPQHALEILNPLLPIR